MRQQNIGEIVSCLNDGSQQANTLSVGRDHENQKDEDDGDVC